MVKFPHSVISNIMFYSIRKLYGASSKTQLMERDVQTLETVNYCIELC